VTNRPYDSVLCDLLTALLDSWSLWNSVAGSDEAGARWRAEYLRITYGTGAYRPYEDLVAEAAVAVGLPADLTRSLDARYGELRPWPGVTATLKAVAARGIPIGVVTNCSERLGQVAAACVGVDFAAVITAERAGVYKPDPRAYQSGLQALNVAPARCLFVAGSAYDLFGTAPLGLPTFWHDRIGMTPPPGMPKPLAHERNLEKLLPLLEDSQ
jgi:2-haloalkanoic acid dehalogenase type II